MDKTRYRFLQGQGSINSLRPVPVGNGTWFLLAVLLISGCATMEGLDLPRRRPSFPEIPINIPYRDYAGIFHVHSRYSHDSKGKLDEIVRSSRKARADFVVLTDHNTLEGLRDKMDGFYGDTLVLIGNEVSTHAGHIAVLGIDKEFGPGMSPAEVLEEVRRLGGLSFVSHGESPRSPWQDWSLGPLTGMEIYNLAGDVYEDGKPWVFMKVLFLTPRIFFRSVLDKPERYMVRWDKLMTISRKVGVGAVDAHQKVRILGRAIDDYDTMFKVVQTHVWAETLSPEGVLDALAKGRVYVGFDIVKPVRNFLFVAESSVGYALMGDEIPFESGLEFKVFLPAEAKIHLLRDGRILESVESDSLRTSVPGPGIYRVEVYRGRRLWIVSNPIYVRQASRAK